MIALLQRVAQADVTVDGNGTTSRVEGIVLSLLDELHRLGRV